jgi:hypothetical protein
VSAVAFALFLGCLTTSNLGQLVPTLIPAHTQSGRNVLEYRARRDVRLAGLAELTAIDEELGFDY